MNEDYIAPPEVVEAVKEASISIACCLDEVEDVTKEDLEHIQDQITVMENYFGVKNYESKRNNI